MNTCCAARGEPAGGPVWVGPDTLLRGGLGSDLLQRPFSI